MITLNTGEVIKYLRKKRKMTQEDLAALLGVKKSSIQKYESGKVQNLKIGTIQKLCQIYGITPFALVFPNEWEKFKMPYVNSVEFLDQTKKYFELNDEGKQKVLTYLRDIAEIERYKQKDEITRQIKI